MYTLAHHYMLPKNIITKFNDVLSNVYKIFCEETLTHVHIITHR